VPASPIVLATIPMNARVPRATRLSMRDFHLTFTVAARGSQAGRVSWNARNTLTSKEDRVTDNALVTCLWFDTEGEAAAAYYGGLTLKLLTRFTGRVDVQRNVSGRARHHDFCHLRLAGGDDRLGLPRRAPIE